MLRTNVHIAIRHLVSKKRQTVVAVLGVTFGIAMYVLMASAMTGVNKMVDDLSFKSTAHIRLYKEADISKKTILQEIYGDNAMILVHHQGPKIEKLQLKNPTEILQRLKSDPDVVGVSAQVSTPVFYNYGTIQYNGSLLGVNVADEDSLFALHTQIESGSMNDIIAISNGMLIGAGMAKKFNLSTGDNVTVTTPKGVVVVLKVVGIYKSGLGAIDNSRSYVSLHTAQKILQKDKTYITDISLKIKNMYTSREKAPLLASQFDAKAEDWQTANSVMLSGMTIRNLLTYVVSLTLLVVAGFGIYNIMSMSVNNKMKDIAILKATGFSSSDIVQIFMYQALIIGLLGAVTGMTAGFILSFGVSKIPFSGGDFFSIDHFPVNFSPIFYVIAIVFGVATTLLAAYTPSKKASNIDPVVILRG